jgi:hypothetical protein
VIAFFRAAGIATRLEDDGRLWINGSQAESLPHRSSSNWDEVINELTMTYAQEKLMRTIEENIRFDGGLRHSLLTREGGFAIMSGEVRLALIRATHAFIPQRVKFVHANFLTSGPHWEEVDKAVRHAQARLMAKHKKVKAEEAGEAAKVKQRRTATQRQEPSQHELLVRGSERNAALLRGVNPPDPDSWR